MSDTRISGYRDIQKLGNPDIRKMVVDSLELALFGILFKNGFFRLNFGVWRCPIGFIMVLGFFWVDSQPKKLACRPFLELVSRPESSQRSAGRKQI
jgi:hypothetical protein